MNYQQALDYMFSQLPMFQRTGPAAYKPDLGNTISICNILQNPQNKFISIHVAGTNGKGSTSHMLASIFQEAGYKTGLYTSPHLKDFRERIKINGQMISQSFVADFISKYHNEFNKIEPSFFEMTVGLAFDYFANEKVDIAIIEVGLGGRLDSTNVITPILSVITNISFDHVILLGDTLPKIASEKAGIIKHGIPVVIGETNNQTKEVFIQKANLEKSQIYFADKNFTIKNISEYNPLQNYFQADIYKGNDLVFEKLKCGLIGQYQYKNILTVIQAVDLLKEKFKIEEKHIRNGIFKVVENTGLLGRWQVLNKQPLAICDTGHNEAGITYVINQINKTTHQHLHFVLGLVNDKDIDKILTLLPKQAIYYFCKANIPRALSEEILKEKATALGLNGHTYNSVNEAYQKALKNAGKNDLIFVGGSTFVVAEVV
ncbi:MAG: bifunctional folylpolyglutamate synthase/dihydrofolate synthase [Bacteroidia bacterium]